MQMLVKMQNRYPDWLPKHGYFRQNPQTVSKPKILVANAELAQTFGIDPEWLRSAEAITIWAGNQLPHGADPMALAYAGHQFGTPVPQLGDGRALLLGQLPDASGLLHDFQLKGSGTTPFSRMGDGRAALGPVLRELIVSEAMNALGVPTSRVLTTIQTGEVVHRQAGAEPGAILTRVAQSHLRFGSLEYFINRADIEGVQAVADAAIAWHYPDLSEHQGPERYFALLERVTERTIHVVVEWLRVGFIHGVMNTDNMTLTGETLDYGPCAFMDHFSPQRVLSSVDRGGRYAFNQQPHMAQWNLARLAECLLPLIGEDALDTVSQAIHAIPDQFQRDYNTMMRRKLGLTTEHNTDQALSEALLDQMHQENLDYTNTFSTLTKGEPLPALGEWLTAYHNRLAIDDSDPAQRQALMRKANPIVIPRNHLVEQALIAAEHGDLAPAEQLLASVQQPYTTAAIKNPRFLRPPRQEEIVPATFCGT